MLPKIFLFACLLLILSGCGAPPEPDILQGEDTAGQVVTAFLRAVEGGDFDRARAFLFKSPDHILSDLPQAQELFFPKPSTGMTVLAVGHELYGSDWHISVDLKINYGDQMKPLRFTLVPGETPLVRGVNPLKL